MARRPLIPQNLQVGGGSLSDQARRMRRPQHRFAVRTPPWVIQPVAIAPVLPGDTLREARIQARVVTDPLDGKLLGWWTEMHLFYCKHRDLSESDNLQAMMLQPQTPSAMATVVGSAGPTYRVNGRVDYTQLCLNAVVDWYFRDEGTSHTDHTEALTGLPMAKLGVNSWMDSLVETSTLTSVDVKLDIDNSGTIYASEAERALQQYQWYRQNNLTNMTYEDFLATYGVRTARAQVNKPELLRSIREWTYPTNTVTQGTGAVSSACVWSIAERAEKSRFFEEPGFLLLVSVTKPKVYTRRQAGAAVNMLDNAYTWLPAVLREDPDTSLVAMQTVNSALALSTVVGSALTFDARDLFLYGDQFLYATPSVAGSDSIAANTSWSSFSAGEQVKLGTLSLQANIGEPEYAAGTLAERNDLFVGTSNETNLVQIDGVVTFEIASSVVDYTPGIPAR